MKLKMGGIGGTVMYCIFWQGGKLRKNNLSGSVEFSWFDWSRSETGRRRETFGYRIFQQQWRNSQTWPDGNGEFMKLFLLRNNDGIQILT